MLKMLKILNILTFRILNLKSVCRECKEGELAIEESKRHGLAPELHLTCLLCGHVASAILSEQTKVHKTHMHQVNRRAVLGMRLIGRGYNALCTLSTLLDMPTPMSKATFDSHRNHLYKAAKETGEQSMRRAAEAEISSRKDKEEPRDIAVSTDDTWMRRGYSSLYGVQTVIAWDTHQVLDVEVLSKHCPTCSSWSSRKASGRVTDAQYEQWQVNHAANCMISTDVSAPAMESTAVVSLWSRSEERNGLRYVSYIGDGDSKEFKNVVDSRPYGDTAVSKEECIGHVQKQIGKGMRDLKQKLGIKKLADGKAIGGRGRLTDKRIDSLQNYYRIAVRRHAGNVSATARAIRASLCHEASSNAEPMHQYCPEGSDSWCGYQKMQAADGDEEYQHKPHLPKEVFKELTPLYIRLTEPQLLLRCKRGATQNANEALNGTIWRLCPKESFCGPETVETAVNLAIATFNHGATVLSDVLRLMQCNVGHFTASGLEKIDRLCLYHSAKKCSPAGKKSRKDRRATRKGFLDKAVEKEGVTYAAGSF